MVVVAVVVMVVVVVVVRTIKQRVRVCPGTNCEVHLSMGAMSLWTRPPALVRLNSQHHKNQHLRHDRDVNDIPQDGTVGTQLSPPHQHLWNCTTCTKRASITMRTATGESPWSAEQDHGNEPLHHDGDVDDLSKPAMHKPLPKTTTSAASIGSARCVVTSKTSTKEALHERTQRLDSLQRQAVVQGCLNDGLQA